MGQHNENKLDDFLKSQEHFHRLESKLWDAGERVIELLEKKSHEMTRNGDKDGVRATKLELGMFQQSRMDILEVKMKIFSVPGATSVSKEEKREARAYRQSVKDMRQL